MVEAVGLDREVLPFRIFAYFASPGGIRAQEVEAFHARFESTRWCRSATLPRLLDHTKQRYTELWTQLRAGSLAFDDLLLQRSLGSCFSVAPLVDRHNLARDLLELGRCIRSAKRTFGVRGLRSELRSRAARFRALVERAGQNVSTVAETQQVIVSGGAGTSASNAFSAPVARYWTQGPVRLRCVSVISETHDVKTFSFVATERCRFQYLPGQAATLELDLDGQRVVRTYTISSTPSRPDLLSFTIKRVPHGLVSNWLNDHVRPGFELTVRGPHGRFSWVAQPSERALFISAGSGITPLLSMIRYIYDIGAAVDLVFWHAARTLEDRIAHDELSWLAGRLPCFRLVYCLSRQASEWSGLAGRVTLAKLQASVPDFVERTVFLCGPKDFMRTTETILRDAGLPAERLLSESFGERRASSTPVAPSTSPGEPTQHFALAMPRPSAVAEAHTVELRRSGITLRVTGEPILVAVESAGVSVASSCRSGSCGTCKVRKVSGDMLMDEEAGLEPAARADGFVLLCVGHPTSAVVLDI